MQRGYEVAEAVSVEMAQYIYSTGVALVVEDGKYVIPVVNEGIEQ